MPELRKDPVVGRWVIIATERSRRPSDFTRPDSKANHDFCPFCPGNERATPPEIAAARPPDSPQNGPGWSTRVIPNKFPALDSAGALEELGEGLYECRTGVGVHEVIIETPEHDRELSELTVERIADVFTVYRERARACAQDPRIRHVLVFKNYGEWAGASLEHSHTQLLAMPVVPQVVADELAGALRHFEATGRCAFCDVIDHELREGERVIRRDEGYLVIAPFASRFPFEIWILPLQHGSAFEQTGGEALRGLAAVFKDALGRLNQSLGRPCYNFLIHSAPCGEPALEHYHWHVEIIPKLSRVSGFEWGTGAYINPTPPEEAAEHLRSLEPAERTAP